MMAKTPESAAAPHLLFFGAYDPAYPRNLIIRKGWKKLGFDLSECRVGMKRKVHTRYPLLLLRFLCGERRGDLLFVPDFRHKDVPLAWLVARSSGKRIIFDPLVSRYETKVLDRGDAVEGSPQAWHNRNLDRISFSLPDLILADTAAHAEYYHESYGVNRGRIGVVPVGFDEDIFHSAPPRAEDGTLRVLFYGSFLPLHGVDTIVGAASLLSDEPIRFRIVGEGQTHDAMRRMAESRRLEKVEFLPSVGYADRPLLISGADVVLGIFGTTAKTSMVVPNKVYQALASGRTVVTADTPALREFFREGEHLLTVPRGDHRALADVLRALGSNRTNRLRLAETGGSYVRLEFNSMRIAHRLLEVITRSDL
jgi:glycosyltransferase involved in cell wall biosynthesis